MSDLTNVFTDIADAIRAKTNSVNTYKPTEMAGAINNISGGGGELVYNANGVNIMKWFNTPVTIAEGVTNTASMFGGCSNFNQPVTIPNSVTNTASMFNNCSNFNQPVTVPNSVTNTAYMFNSCLSLTHLFVKANPSLNVRGMVRNKNGSLQLIIETNNTSKFIGNSSVNSITGAVTTWTQDGDNYYNALYNINIINNQSLSN